MKKPEENPGANSEKYPVKHGWVGEGVPWIGRPRRRLLEALDAGEDLTGGEATAPITPASAQTAIEILRRRGFAPEAFVRMKRRKLLRLAEGEAAIHAYLDELMTPHHDHFHWPDGSLVFAHPDSGSRFLIDADEDGQVLELLCWGQQSHAALTEVVEALWREIQREEEGLA